MGSSSSSVSSRLSTPGHHVAIMNNGASTHSSAPDHSAPAGNVSSDNNQRRNRFDRLAMNPIRRSKKDLAPAALSPRSALKISCNRFNVGLDALRKKEAFNISLDDVADSFSYLNRARTKLLSHTDTKLAPLLSNNLSNNSSNKPSVISDDALMLANASTLPRSIGVKAIPDETAEVNQILKQAYRAYFARYDSFQGSITSSQYLGADAIASGTTMLAQIRQQQRQPKIAKSETKRIANYKKQLSEMRDLCKYLNDVAAAAEANHTDIADQVRLHRLQNLSV
jgi:hypothetical protein